MGGKDLTVPLATWVVCHTLLVRKYGLDEITKTITNYIDRSEDKDWGEIALKLSRVFAWEFEDYQP